MQAIRKAERHKIESWLIKQNEERAAEGFPVQSIKQIKENAKQIHQNREQSRPSHDITQTLKDLRAGQRLREQKESKERRQQFKEKSQERGGIEW